MESGKKASSSNSSPDKDTNYNKMLKSLILLSCCYLSCFAASIEPRKYLVKENVETVEPVEHPVAILSSVAELKSDGYIFAFKGADGIYREEVGIVRNAGTDDEALEVSGLYRYTDALGELIEVHYTADKNGFVPEGNNIHKDITKAAEDGAKLAKISSS